MPMPFRLAKDEQFLNKALLMMVESFGMFTLVNDETFWNAATGIFVCFVTLIVVKDEGMA